MYDILFNHFIMALNITKRYEKILRDLERGKDKPCFEPILSADKVQKLKEKAEDYKAELEKCLLEIIEREEGAENGNS